jgi:protoporphyrinogen IX oxidase
MLEIIKALHIIFIVTWFAGLFYIVRLFVYQTEAQEKPADEKKILVPQYRLMSKRLWYGISWPSFILTLVFGPWLLFLNPALLDLQYMQIKLLLVGGLIIYFFICHIMFNKLQKGEGTLSASFFRMWNEVATLFLVAIVFIIVLRDNMNWIYATLAFLGLGILLIIAIKLYKKMREN